MKKSYNIDEEVGKTLDAFKQDQVPEMEPWFLNRLENKIKYDLEGEAQAPAAWWGHVLKPSLMAGLVALNVIALVFLTDVSASADDGRESYLEDLSSQFGLNYTESYMLSEGGSD